MRLNKGLLFRSISLLVFFTGTYLDAFAKLPHLSYEIHKQDSVSLRITLSFKIDKSGKSILHLPSEWAGQRKLYQAISQLHAISNFTKIDTTAKPDEYIISGDRDKNASISYVLKQDWTGPLKYPLYFRPINRKGIFYFEGYSGLLYPEMSDSTKIICTITYTGFDDNEFTGNSFFAGIRKKTFSTTTDHLLNSFYCAGAYRSQSVRIKGTNVIIAVAGKFQFSDQAVFNGISKIVAAERNFWKSNGSKYFFAALLQMDDQGNNGGTAHYQSFVLFQSPDLKMDEGFLPLVSHEYFHNWLGIDLKMPQPSERYKWFSEGFTDYYSIKLLFKAGLITSGSFLTKLNAGIKSYYLSPYFSESNDAIAGKYWTDSQMRLLSYVRGLTIAFWLDNRISIKDSASLDNLMRELYHPQKKEQLFIKTEFDRLVLQYADPLALTIVDKANEGNNQALTQALLKLKNYEVTEVVVNKVFDLGFDLQASKVAKKIIGLRSNSNAAKAGLTENMEITGEFSIYNNNPEKPAQVRTLQNGQKVTVEFIPAKAVDIHVPQILK